jgi:hypothetical protein
MAGDELRNGQPPLFLDLDGVLADFDAHVEALFGAPPSGMPIGQMWARAARTRGFFETMPLTPDALELWTYCLPFGPSILTGLPRGNWAEAQKRRWVAAHLGDAVPVITCMSRDKCEFATPGAVLVDDTTRYAERWVERGGIFVHHTSARASIDALRTLGFEATMDDQ